MQTVNGVYGSQSPWSQTYSFVTDFVAPAAAGAFTSLSSTGGVMARDADQHLLAGVTAQISVQDAQSGLVVSTIALAFAGDGHNNPGTTAGFGVIYSTNAGQTWIDASTMTAVNNGLAVVSGASQLRGMAVFNGRLYVADGANGKVYASGPDGPTAGARSTRTRRPAARCGPCSSAPTGASTRATPAAGSS